MHRLIAAVALALTATAAAAAGPGPDIQTSNQFLDPGENALTINHIALLRAARVVAIAPDAYGSARNGQTLGQVRVSPGEHHDVRLPIDQQALIRQHYTPGSNHRVLLEVRENASPPTARANAILPIKVRIPDPVDEVD